MPTQEFRRELESVVSPGAVVTPAPVRYLSDEAETRGLHGHCDLVVIPETAVETRDAVACCYAHDVPIVPRGGGTGYAGGCVPYGGVVLSTERLTRIKSFEPERWRVHAEAGVVTSRIRQLARENGLLFPPDPGAEEQSNIGGNIATNAGGPHAFKYGSTGAWVTGLEVVVPPGRLISVGGSVRKDVAGYDLRALLIGSEGTLGIITSAWLRLIPAPAVSYPVAVMFDGLDAACDAIDAVVGNGIVAAALEFFDATTIAASLANFPEKLPTGYLVIVEVDGAVQQAQQERDELIDIFNAAAGFVGLYAPIQRHEVERLWKWRETISGAVTTLRGGKVSEDISVPFEKVRDAVRATVEIGDAYGLQTCTWGHAGDGNLHSTFLIDVSSSADRERADSAAQELFVFAGSLGGSISGEHGIGLTKSGQLGNQWREPAIALHGAIKQLFDPRGLMNPGKKVA